MRVFLETPILVPTLLLIVASVTDVYSRKFPNWMFLIGLGLGAVWLWYFEGIAETVWGLLTAVILILALSPLVFVKALGGGDVKLLAVFSLFTSWQIALYVLVYSLFWALLMGLSKLLLSGEAKEFFKSFALRNPQVKNQHIPYTVALLLGWMTYVQIGGVL